MSNNIELKQLKKDHENPISIGGGRKTPSLKPMEQTLKCPRCDSTNTKFCYYNNYNLTQPRHFCKTCRRYWTKGGALRNIPIGGGCRKKKKVAIKSCSSRFLVGDSSLADSGGLKLLDGISPPAMDFQLGGLTYPPRVSQFSCSYGENAPTFMNITDPNLAVNFPEMGFTDTNLTSSIESLSFLNQDLHWKLQQQRLAEKMFHQKETSLQPILFQNLEISKTTTQSSSRKDVGLATEWFLDNNYGPQLDVNPESAGNYQNANINNWNGINQAWNQYNALP